jgi:membrane protease YdiL (CAAX protease family)
VIWKPLTFGAQKELHGFDLFVDTVKPVVPIIGVPVLVYLVWFLLFRNTWRELDEEAHRHRGELLAKGTTDYRPVYALVMCGLILAMQEYYGTRTFFDVSVRPLLEKWDAKGALHLAKYNELWGYVWWAGTRIGGYVFPFVAWKAFFRKDSILDFGLRTRGFLDHVWIYFLFLLVVVPATLVVSTSPDFGSYYPFYKTAYRSWFDFLCWEGMYFAQFFALEMFFRGFWLGALRRSFGSGAIFAMAVPYCMIHFGKPYLEVCGAIVAGIALGSLSMKTRSIYQGFLVHITIALLMDWLSLRHQHCIPVTFWPPDTPAGCTEQLALRDGMARHVESFAIPIAVAVLALAVTAYVRHRRWKSQQI